MGSNFAAVFIVWSATARINEGAEWLLVGLPAPSAISHLTHDLAHLRGGKALTWAASLHGPKLCTHGLV